MTLQSNNVSLASFKVLNAPERIDFFGRVLDLEVTKTKISDSPFAATYWHGADGIFTEYGNTPEEAARKLWRFMRKYYPSVKEFKIFEVELNGRVYDFEWITEAVKFSMLFDGKLLTPINSI
jgi:hypothetical protein